MFACNFCGMQFSTFEAGLDWKQDPNTMYRMQKVITSESKLFGQTAVLCHTAIHSNVLGLVFHSFPPRKQVLMSTLATWIGEY